MEKSWNDKYLINIKDIDEQHRGFFELWDQKQKMADLENPDQLAQIIEKLEDYIKFHFSYEEKLLEDEGYENIENHKSQHRYFIQKVDEMKQELVYLNPLLFEKTAAFMKKWFLGHIMQSDKNYAQAIKNEK